MSEQSNTATLRQQAGRVDEDAVDRAVEAFHDVYDGVSHNERDALRHVLAIAALAQNTQGEAIGYVKPKELEDYQRAKSRGLRGGAIGIFFTDERSEIYSEPVYLHAERARVPEGMAEALEALRPFANAYHRLRSYGDNPTDETPLYAYFGEGHPLYELLDGEHGPRLTVQSLEKAAAVLAAAPHQRAEVK